MADMVLEDIAQDFNSSEITFQGYKTKNLHHSQDARNAFNSTIQRAKNGLIDDRGAILRALKSTDVYMGLNDLHPQQNRSANPEELTQWSKEHQKAAGALKTLGGNEFMHHFDYWNNHKQELQMLQASAAMNNPMGESLMTNLSHNPFQDALDLQEPAKLNEKKFTPSGLKMREEISAAVAKRVAEQAELDEARGYAYSQDGGANDERHDIDGYSPRRSYARQYRPAPARSVSAQHHVEINGRKWKSFADKDEAHRAAGAVQRKYPEKKVSVHTK